jgi:hypothetical protein
MESRSARAEAYREEANRLRQQASGITDSRRRIELLDMATHYEMLAATAEPTDHHGSHRLRRRLLPFE